MRAFDTLAEAIMLLCVGLVGLITADAVVRMAYVYDDVAWIILGVLIFFGSIVSILSAADRLMTFFFGD